MSYVRVGETIKLKITCRDMNGELFAPSSLSLTATSPSGTESEHSTSDSNPATVFNPSTGIYRSYFDADEAGTWTVDAEIVYSENGQSITEREEYQFAVYEA